jgi:hypothetical protein
MKKIVLIASLVPLVLFEVYLCTAFLPLKWQHAINDRVANILPKSSDTTPITHPFLNLEIEQVLREHVGLRIAVYAITVALLVANTWFICFIWRFFRATQRESENSKI